MQKNNFIYMPRLILYVVGAFVCGVLLYIRFSVTPQVKAQSEARIEASYQSRDFLGALNACQQMAARFPEEAIWQLHMGKCYDGLQQDVEFQQTLREKCRKNLEQPFYTEAQRKLMKQSIEGVDLYLQKIPQGDLVAQALSCYQKTYALSPTWYFASKIAESHVLAGRAQEAIDLLKKTPTPASPSDVLELSLWQTEAAAQLAAQNKIASEDFAQQCRHIWQLYAALPAAYHSDKLLASRVANSQVYLAQLCEQKGDLPEARKNYLVASRLSPNNIDIACAYANVVQKQGDYVEAEEFLLKIVRLNQQIVGVQQALASVSLRLWKQEQAFYALEQALYLAKRDVAQTVVQEVASAPIWQRCHKHPDLQMLMGWFYQAPPETAQKLREAIHFVWQKQLDMVRPLCEEIIKMDAKSYPAYLLSLYATVGQKGHKLAWEQHLAAHKKKLEAADLAPLEKAELEREVAKTKIYIKSQKVDELDIAQCDKQAAEQIQNIRQLTGNNTQIEVAIIAVYFFYEMYRDVLTAMPLVMAQEMDNELKAICYYLEGYAHWQLKENAEAQKAFAKAQELAPEVPLYAILHARALLNLEQKDAAVTEYGKALLLTKGIPFYHYEGGMFLLGLEKLAEASEQFRACTSVRSSQFMAWYQLGKIALKQNNATEALQMLDQAFKNKGDIEVLSQLLRTESEWKVVYGAPEFRRILRTYQYRQ
jgi:tetratricopeptide (TPR) repeat protein